MGLRAGVSKIEPFAETEEAVGGSAECPAGPAGAHKSEIQPTSRDVARSASFARAKRRTSGYEAGTLAAGAVVQLLDVRVPAIASCNTRAPLMEPCSLCLGRHEIEHVDDSCVEGALDPVAHELDGQATGIGGRDGAQGHRGKDMLSSCARGSVAAGETAEFAMSTIVRITATLGSGTRTKRLATKRAMRDGRLGLVIRCSARCTIST